MKIALVQQHSTKNKKENIERGLKAVEKAASEGAELIAFPELSFDFFFPQYSDYKEAINYAEPIPGPTTDLFCRKANELKILLIINLFEKDGEKTYDTSVIINERGEIIGKTRMVHIIEAPYFHEKHYYSPGNLGAGVFQTKLGKIGIAVCYDRHFPEYMRALALKGAELVIVPQAGAVNEWPPGIFEAELQIASFQNGYFSALVNRVGKEDLITFAGESYVTDPEGKIIAKAPKGEDYILYADINFDLLKNCSARKHFLPDRRPDIYDSL